MDRDRQETDMGPAVLPDGATQTAIRVSANPDPAHLGPKEIEEKLHNWMMTKPQITIEVKGELWDWMSTYAKSPGFEELSVEAVERGYDLKTLSNDELDVLWVEFHNRSDYFSTICGVLKEVETVARRQRAHFLEKIDGVLAQLKKKQEWAEILSDKAYELAEGLAAEDGKPAWRLESPKAPPTKRARTQPASEDDGSESDTNSVRSLDSILFQHHRDREARLEAIQKEHLDTIQKAQEDRDRKTLHEYIQGMSPQRKKLCWAMVPIWNKLKREEWLDYEVYRVAIRKYGAPTWVDRNGKLIEASDHVQKILWERQRNAREAMDCFRTTLQMPVFTVDDESGLTGDSMARWKLV